MNKKAILILLFVVDMFTSSDTLNPQRGVESLALDLMKSQAPRRRIGHISNKMFPTMMNHKYKFLKINLNSWAYVLLFAPITVPNETSKKAARVKFIWSRRGKSKLLKRFSQFHFSFIHERLNPGGD